MTDPRSILVINVTRIGDTLFTTPVLRALATRWPQASLTVLAHPKRMEVLANLPGITRLGGIEKRRAVFRGRWPGKSYDLALVYGHDEALIAYALRVARRVVAFRQKDEGLNARLYRIAEEPPPHGEHAVDRALRLTDALGVPHVGKRLSLALTDSELAWAGERLQAECLAEARPLIGLQVSSFPTKAYRDWPVEHFAELCARVSAQWPGAGFLIFGGPEEKERTHWLKAQLGERAALLAGRLSLRQTAAMMSRVDAYVGVDTGPTHLMGTFDIPLVGLYHCLLPKRIYGPLDHPLDFGLDHPRCCEPTCSEQTPMAEISVDSVFGRLQQALSQGKEKP